MTETTDLTFSVLAVGDEFQVTAERRKATRLPEWTYRKVDDVSAKHCASGTREIFAFNTPVVRSERIG